MVTDKKLKGLFSDWEDVLDSVMPGGKNWHSASGPSSKKFICLKDCPLNRRGKFDCDEQVCRESKGWQGADANAANLAVMLHVMEYFDYYNMGDLPGLSERSAVVVDLRRRILAELGRQVARKE
jgi:hypothetical protein